jgi:tetratricopeptide (TPR) repeat protein
LILEKIPILALALASVCLSLFSLQSYGSVKNLNDVSILLRIENALVSCIKYIVKMIWPTKLAIFYPYPETVPLWQTLCAVALLICLTIVFIWVFRKKPYIGVGWLWYLGTFIPVSGLVQSGVWPALADRWAYVPFIGLFIMIAWGIAYPMQHRGRYKTGLAALILVILAAFTVCTWTQVKYWRNSVTLFQHALTVNPENWLAHSNLGDALATKGNFVKASQHFAQALRLNPNEEHVQVNYGYVLLMQGRAKQAASHFREALRVNPGFAEAHNNLGLYLIRNGELEQSIRHFQLALRNRPNYLNAARNLKLALFINEKINTAAKRLNDALVLSLRDPELDQKIDIIIKRKYELNQAIARYQKSLSRQPGFVKLDINKITAVAQIKWQYKNTLPVFKKIIELRPENAGTYYNIACIYGSQGKDKESLIWFNQALQKGFDKWDIIKTDFDLENIKKLSNYKQFAKDS